MLPDDYIARVYAGILGKLIGVYLGRPFEQWTHQRIMAELGPITNYVNKRLGVPLVVTDDDVSGTFTFLRALEDHRLSPDLSAAEIGLTWLNYIIERKTILWWGGVENSTEHRAWANLKAGVSAPESGSIARNGITAAEQIGAQIFIDGWALVAPGRPVLAAELARQSASVSHDGEAVHAAMLWAAMEAEAFLSKDINHLLETGLQQIPQSSGIRDMIADVRTWCAQDDDWMVTRGRVEERYGYSNYPGNCHVVPNHALMIMSLLHSQGDFHRAQYIVNTSGCDTDCNAGNVGCLLGIMSGLEGLEGGPDWRGPIADRMLISSADGGWSINDATRMAYYVAGLGYQLAGLPVPDVPKSGAQFHFSLLGSVQGFGSLDPALLNGTILQNSDGQALQIVLPRGLSASTVYVGTPVFAQPDVREMITYDLVASPLVYPGQRVTARVRLGVNNPASLQLRLSARYYDGTDQRQWLHDEWFEIAPGEVLDLSWVVADTGGMPLSDVGLMISVPSFDRKPQLTLDYMKWEGVPELTLQPPDAEAQFWRRAWVSNTEILTSSSGILLRGTDDPALALYGTREWSNYRLRACITVNGPGAGGLIIGSQGMQRYVAVKLHSDGTLQVSRRHDGEEELLGSFTERLATTDVELQIDFLTRQIVILAAGQLLRIDRGVPVSGAAGFIADNAMVCSPFLMISPL